MAQASEDSSDICKLCEYGERLNAAKDKSAHASDFEAIMRAAAAEDSSVKVKQLAAQFIPKFVNYFPSLSCQALDQCLFFLEEEDFGKNVERDAMHRTLMSLLRQYIKSDMITQLFRAFSRRTLGLLGENLRWQMFDYGSTTTFEYIGSTEEANPDEAIREKVLRFIKDKVFPLEEELSMPQEEMERHITDLVKKSLSLFGPNAPVESFQQLAEIIEEQADLDAQFNIYMVRKKLQEKNFSYIERLLFTFHH